MCFINQPIYNISNTNIIIITKDDSQITIYSNCIYNEYDDNIMIIPVPNPETISFLNLDSINGLLLEDIIDNTDDTDYIVDNYYTKLYNNIDDLLIDKEFSLSTKCMNELMSYSGSTKNNQSNKLWGFIVCKLNKGNVKYLPIVYKHKMITNHSFIPTRAYYKIESYNNYFFNSYNYYWNHNISLINNKENIILNSISSDRFSKKLNLPVNLAFNNILNLKNNINIEKYIIKGYQLNIDFFIYNL